jgi:ubiquinone/menaquinone biosynthesis C-methylase UbiE
MDHQFVKERKRIKSIFNLALLIYPLIELNLIPQYRKTLKKLNLPNNLSVLDFATGTGILAGAFHDRGHSVQGIDFSQKLLKRARKKYPVIQFDQIDLFELDTEQTPKVDIVSMGYLLHGLSPDLRKIILKKASKIASKYVVVFDHSNRTNWIVDIIEYLEGSHYKEFITADHKHMFAEANLEIIKEFNVDEFGYCWLCGK